MTVKRAFDLVIGTSLLVLSLPVLAIAAAAVRLSLGQPAFFRQVRAGRHGRPFTLYKLRTMTNAKDASGQLLPSIKRLTPLGRLLRASSIDELPELFNVLRGDMSLVGPRPLPIRYLERFTPTQARRHEVQPGITGWAQIHGRNLLMWEERFELDVWYVDNRSMLLDVRILLRTVWQVSLATGVSPTQRPIMEEFRGSRA